MDLTQLYSSFDGRINRQPYWVGTLILALVEVLVALVAAEVLGASIMAPDFRLKLFMLAMQAVFFYPLAALMVKRLNDRDRPAWLAAVFLAPGLIKSVTTVIGLTGNPLSLNPLDLVLGVLVPAVEIWCFIELGCLRGTEGTNQHGPNPLDVDRERSLR
jgi:uncharacterized membrane protein YhaH (DUF805 family)